MLSIFAAGDVSAGTTGIYAVSYGADADDLSLYIYTPIGAGTVSGGDTGIVALNYGDGALGIITHGLVEGTNNIGIYARNGDSVTSAGTDLSISTEDVTGGNTGIDARNFGSGALTITAYGDVEGTNIAGIVALNSTLGNPAGSTYLSITTEGVTSDNVGINARNYGSGALTIVANGDVEGTGAIGIYARSHGADNGMSLSITTEATVTGGSYGMIARNYGAGALTIQANGDIGDVDTTVPSQTYAYNQSGADGDTGIGLSVTTGAGTTVTAGERGIVARNYGTGALAIEASGDVTGTGYEGILRGTKAPISSSRPAQARMGSAAAISASSRATTAPARQRSPPMAMSPAQTKTASLRKSSTRLSAISR